MKRNLKGNQNAIRIEALADAGECYEPDLGKLQNGSRRSHSASCKALLYNYSSHKHGSRVAFIHLNVITTRFRSLLLELTRRISCLIPTRVVPLHFKTETLAAPGHES